MSQSLKHSDHELSWRERANDDLVLALGLGLWIGERNDGIPRGMSYGTTVYGSDEDENDDPFREF